MALRDVPSLLTVDRVVRAGRVTQRALREWFGIAEPRLAICAVNPHGGEAGLFGDEEITIIAPAIAAAKFGGTGSLWISYYDNSLGKLVAATIEPFAADGRITECLIPVCSSRGSSLQGQAPKTYKRPPTPARTERPCCGDDTLLKPRVGITGHSRPETINRSTE